MQENMHSLTKNLPKVKNELDEMKKKMKKFEKKFESLEMEVETLKTKQTDTKLQVEILKMENKAFESRIDEIEGDLKAWSEACLSFRCEVPGCNEKMYPIEVGLKCVRIDHPSRKNNALTENSQEKIKKLQM